MQTIAGVPSFACCFALLVWIWHEHNMFFRRYGLRDGWTVVLNAGLLFITLFYVYPLKFMFDSLFAELGAIREVQRMNLVELSRVSAIYGFGFLAVFLMFALLYRRAYQQRHLLQLTALETFDVETFTRHHLLSAGVGLLSIVVSLLLPVSLAPLAPLTFALMGPLHWTYGTRRVKKRQAMAGDVGELGPASSSTRG